MLGTDFAAVGQLQLHFYGKSDVGIKPEIIIVLKQSGQQNYDNHSRNTLGPDFFKGAFFM